MIFFVIWLATLVLIVWATLDAATTPGRLWEAADQDKIVWVLVILFLPLFGAIAYFVSVRPKLRAHRRSND
ncbi:MAG TPA: PLDc N-terminal domain-containing protein [Actinomycetota bacterium]|nr:PLDc N-terminal domain-containing protein [Actinomycetota bacterium]